MYTVEFKASNDAVANGIRRAVLLYVPALAIHWVEVHENTTSFPDQFLAHRLAMVALSAAPALQLTEFDKCSCDGLKCSKCTIIGNLDVQGNQKGGGGGGVIAAKWGDITGPAGKLVIKNACEQTICWLGVGKRLRCTIWAARGTHMQHAKWAVASVATIQPNYRLKFDSIGNLPASEIYRRTLRAMIEKLNQLRGRINP